MGVDLLCLDRKRRKTAGTSIRSRGEGEKGIKLRSFFQNEEKAGSLREEGGKEKGKRKSFFMPGLDSILNSKRKRSVTLLLSWEKGKGRRRRC